MFYFSSHDLVNWERFMRHPVRTVYAGA